MFNLMGLKNGTAAIQTNVSCTCNCKRSTSFQSMEITQLEFVQILVIVVVMMVMVVVITCLLNHYRLSARSFISRHSQARRRHLPLASDGGLWPSDGPGSSSGVSEQQVYSPRPPDRVPSYLQRERLARFQPTYPYLPHSIIDLPPTISLSDGEEPPPYQGPCTLQLRDPEQQLELNRESVRAPPNRTVFDSHLADTPLCPPSLHAGVSAASARDCPGRRASGVPPPPTARSSDTITTPRCPGRGRPGRRTPPSPRSCTGSCSNRTWAAWRGVTPAARKRSSRSTCDRDRGRCECDRDHGRRRCDRIRGRCECDRDRGHTPRQV